MNTDLQALVTKNSESSSSSSVYGRWKKRKADFFYSSNNHARKEVVGGQRPPNAALVESFVKNIVEGKTTYGLTDPPSVFTTLQSYAFLMNLDADTRGHDSR